jgi:hypothetical protein
MLARLNDCALAASVGMSPAAANVPLVVAAALVVVELCTVCAWQACLWIETVFLFDACGCLDTGVGQPLDRVDRRPALSRMQGCLAFEAQGSLPPGPGHRGNVAREVLGA